MNKRPHPTSLRDIKSISSAGIRSIPKVQRSLYLDLYMLKREENKVEQAMIYLDKRRNSLRKQLQSIKQRVDRLQKEMPQEQQVVKSSKNIERRPLKRIAITY